MWSEQKRERFQELRQRQADTLSQTEQAELAQFVQQLEDAECAYLVPATERLRREREALDAQNRKLEILMHRKEQQLKRLPLNS
jgi:hypothetical protein